MDLDRRRFLQLLAAAPLVRPAADDSLLRTIPSTGDRIPAIGLGSWITFNVGDDVAARDACTEVIRGFFAAGGRLIDSSPMYGSSQAVIGFALARLRDPRVISADKVWTSGDGAAQIEESRSLWRVPRFDLLQVHNLLSWEKQLALLDAMKRDGKLRYAGVTTSHGRRHDELESIMRRRKLDFIQVTYNPVDRDVEQRILPLARDRGMAVIVNRPFQEGALIRRLFGKPLPGFARDIGATSWAQIVLKFIVSHPAVTCAIPATTVISHARENVNAARGGLPDEAMRRKIVDAISAA